jgi:hypothetical protein
MDLDHARYPVKLKQRHAFLQCCGSGFIECGSGPNIWIWIHTVSNLDPGFHSVLRIRIWDPVPFKPLDPRWESQDLGSGMEKSQIQDQEKHPGSTPLVSLTKS